MCLNEIMQKNIHKYISIYLGIRYQINVVKKRKLPISTYLPSLYEMMQKNIHKYISIYLGIRYIYIDLNEDQDAE